MRSEAAINNISNITRSTNNYNTAAGATRSILRKPYMYAKHYQCINAQNTKNLTAQVYM